MRPRSHGGRAGAWPSADVAGPVLRERHGARPYLMRHAPANPPWLSSFFRDTNCPFCNARLFMLTHRYKEYSTAGLDVVAFFSATHEQVDEFLRIRPRPFRVIADPKMSAYQAYGIQRSLARKVKGVARRPGLWMRGMRILGFKRTVKAMGGLRTTNVMPADILVDEHGRVVEAYYGQDAGDHMPFERIERFIGLGAH